MRPGAAGLIACAAVLAGSACSQRPTADLPRAVLEWCPSGNVTPPKRSSGEDFDLDEVPAVGAGGEIHVRCLIRADGTPEKCRAERSLNTVADAFVVAQVSTWRFAPATCDGEPVEISYELRTKLRPPK